MLDKNLGRKFGYFTTNNDPQVKQQTGEYKGFLLRNSAPVRDQEEATAYITAADTPPAGGASTPLPASGGTLTSTPACAWRSSPPRDYLKAKYDGKWLVRQTTRWTVSRTKPCYRWPVRGTGRQW